MKFTWGRITRGVVAGLLCLLFTGLAKATYLPDIQRIKANGKIIVALVNRETPPFFMKDKNNQLFGFDIEMAKRIGQELGVKVEFLQTAKSFDEVVEQVNQKKADMAISQLTSNLRRAQSVYFTKPYITLKHAILINRVKNFDLNKDDMKSIMLRMQSAETKIGVMENSAYVDYAKMDFPNANIVTVPSTEKMIADLTAGTTSFVMMGETEAENWLHFHPESSIHMKAVLNSDRRDPLAIAVSFDRPYLQEWLNLFIDTIKYDGTFDRLKKYYVEGFEWSSRRP